MKLSRQLTQKVAKLQKLRVKCDSNHQIHQALKRLELVNGQFIVK